MKIINIARYAARLSQGMKQILEDLHYHRSVANKQLPNLYSRIIDQTRLLALSGITAKDYYWQGLYRPNLSSKSKREFLGRFQLWRWFNILNPKEYNVLIDDKLIFQAYASSAGLPTPQILAIIGGSDIPSIAKKLTTTEDVVDWLESTHAEHFVIKPLAGSKGGGILSLGRRISGKMLWERFPDRQPIKLDEILDHLAINQARNWRLKTKACLIQKRLEPHPILANIAPDVLHTLRIVTLRNGDPEVIVGALRIGMGKGPTDNLARGGLVAPVDLKTGILGNAAYVCDGLVRRTDIHPVTHTQILGIQVPYWHETLSLVLCAAQHFAFSDSLGWDVGLTPEGPVIIEANNMFNPIVVQLAHDKGLMSTPIGKILSQRNTLINIGLGIRRD